nr:unnamed protein product [Callosobruchus analis]
MAAVPGIGPAVPEELIQTVCEYMEKVAASQRGMVMPQKHRKLQLSSAGSA